MKIYVLWFRVKISRVSNFEVKRWTGGAGGLIVGTSSRMWPPEARTDNFFTRPNAMPRMQDNAMHYYEIHFFDLYLYAVHNSTTQSVSVREKKGSANFMPVLWNLKTIGCYTVEL